jgi:hypothetical protein
MKEETAMMDPGSAALFDRKTTTFTRKAPIVMPGQMRYPRSRIIAKAIPDGGHTGEAFVL